jgi:hypothetical protein
VEARGAWWTGQGGFDAHALPGRRGGDSSGESTRAERHPSRPARGRYRRDRGCSGSGPRAPLPARAPAPAAGGPPSNRPAGAGARGRSARAPCGAGSASGAYTGRRTGGLRAGEPCAARRGTRQPGNLGPATPEGWAVVPGEPDPVCRAGLVEPAGAPGRAPREAPHAPNLHREARAAPETLRREETGFPGNRIRNREARSGGSPRAWETAAVCGEAGWSRPPPKSRSDFGGPPVHLYQTFSGKGSQPREVG